MPARKRELIEPTPGDKRYVRRDKEGKFKDVVDVGKSLAADRRSKSKTVVPPGQGDRGDVKRSTKSTSKKSASTKSPATKSTSKKSSSKKSAAKKK